MEIQFTLPINSSSSRGQAGSSQPASRASATKVLGGTHRFALDSRTRHTRRSSTRARTGCSTCKKRHVKCDETRPSCLNCMKWRGYCDSYQDSTSSSSQTSNSSKPINPASSNATLIHTKKAPLLITEPAVNTVRFTSDDQRIYFNEWSNLSVNFLGGFNNQTRLWMATMPQVTLEEPTLRYGAMAIGALRKAYEFEDPMAGLSTDNKHYLNAVIYYCEALRIQAQMKPTREGLRTALLSSLLFTCFESQRGNMAAALKHVIHGFSMLNELANCTSKAPDLVSIAQAPPSLVQDILDCYRPLELQSRSFMGSYKKFFPPRPADAGAPPLHASQTIPQKTESPLTTSPPTPVPSPPSQPGTPWHGNSPPSGGQSVGLPSPQSQGSPGSHDGKSPPQSSPRRPPGIAPFTKHSPYFRPKLVTITSIDNMPTVFTTWDEMHGYWGLVQRQMVLHTPMLTMITTQLALQKATSQEDFQGRLAILKSNPKVSKFVAEARYWLARWSEAFHPLYQSYSQNSRNDLLMWQKAMSLRIEYLVLYIYTTVPRCCSLITVKGLTPQYREINVLAEKLLQSRPNCGFAMDAGWTWPLFVASFGCRDPAVRAESIRILGQYPIRNALRDSRVFRAIALKNEETEVLNALEGDENEQWLRLQRRELVFEDFGSSIIYRSARKDPITGEWVLVEQAAGFDLGSDGLLVWNRQPVSDSDSVLAGML